MNFEELGVLGDRERLFTYGLCAYKEGCLLFPDRSNRCVKELNISSKAIDVIYTSSGLVFNVKNMRDIFGEVLVVIEKIDLSELSQICFERRSNNLPSRKSQYMALDKFVCRAITCKLVI